MRDVNTFPPPAPLVSTGWSCRSGAGWWFAASHSLMLATATRSSWRPTIATSVITLMGAIVPERGTQMPPWLQHFLGLDSASGTSYLTWSGSGSVIIPPLITLAGITALYFYHHFTCARPACLRYVRHPGHDGKRHCHRHPAPARPRQVPDRSTALPASVDALGEAIVQLSEQISGLAEVVRASLNREAP
jgi:hypothetical protein